MKNGVIINSTRYKIVKNSPESDPICQQCALNAKVAYCEKLCDFFGGVGNVHFEKIISLNEQQKKDLANKQEQYADKVMTAAKKVLQDDPTKKCKSESFVRIRCIIAYLLYEKAMSLSQIGKILKRSNGSVYNALQQHQNYIFINEKAYINALNAVQNFFISNK